MFIAMILHSVLLTMLFTATIRDLGLVGRNPGQKSTESDDVDVAPTGYLISGAQGKSADWINNEFVLNSGIMCSGMPTYQRPQVQDLNGNAGVLVLYRPEADSEGGGQWGGRVDSNNKWNVSINHVGPDNPWPGEPCKVPTDAYNYAWVRPQDVDENASDSCLGSPGGCENGWSEWGAPDYPGSPSRINHDSEITVTPFP